MPESAMSTTGRRNLWIILGTCLGVAAVACAVSAVWLYRKKSRRTSIFSGRSVTPLRDEEIESWRKPGEWTHREARYTVMPKKPLPIAHVSIRTSASFEKDEYSIERPQTPRTPTMQQSQNFSRPMSAHKTTNNHSRRRNSSIYSDDRPPTPYSPSKGEKDRILDDGVTAPTAPPPTRRPQQHRHYPSVSEVSSFDFDLNKSPVRHNFESRSSRR